MISNPNYRKAFFAAIGLHLFLIIMLLMEHSNQRPVVTAEHENSPGFEQAIAVTPQPELIKAVSVDKQQVLEAVNRLKQERTQQQKAEIQRQNELKRQAEVAKQQRLKEQKHLARLQEEANKIAILRKKQAEEEKKRLKQLTEQKALETLRVEALKKEQETLLHQQQMESKKLADLNKKKMQLKSEQEHEQKQERAAAAARSSAQNAERQAHLAGVVDKYKALILNAIGKNWILPEHVDSSLSSQFRIRLAPDGTVLDVVLTRSSGDPLLDRSAQNAIYKSSPLPVPSDSETFNLFRDISLTVRPEQTWG